MEQFNQENMPKQEDIPSREEVQEELELDMMDFFSSMVRSDPRRDEDEEEETLRQLKRGG